jgi:hypothetical protein
VKGKIMTDPELELAIDQAQWLVRRLTEAKNLRFYMMPEKAEKIVKSAAISLNDVANTMGFLIIAKANDAPSELSRKSSDRLDRTNVREPTVIDQV